VRSRPQGGASLRGTEQAANRGCSDYRVAPCPSIKARASSAVRSAAREPNEFDSLFVKSGCRREENFAGSNAPLVVWKTQTYSW
jgi:hypothetical protein